MLIPEVYEENKGLRPEFECLQSAEGNLSALEAQIAAYQNEADEHDSLRAELEGVRAEVEKIRNRVNAARVAVEEKDAEEAALARQTTDSSRLGFERCQD